MSSFENFGVCLMTLSVYHYMYTLCMGKGLSSCFVQNAIIMVVLLLFFVVVAVYRLTEKSPLSFVLYRV